MAQKVFCLGVAQQGRGEEGFGDRLPRGNSGREPGHDQAGGERPDIAGQPAERGDALRARQRMAFGHPISQFQAIQFMLADMATEIDAARLLVRKAAWKQDSGARFSMDAAIAKLFSSEMATRVTHKAIQIHGGYGYSREYPVERKIWYAAGAARLDVLAAIATE